MPFILAGVFTLLGVGVVNLTTKSNGDSIFSPPPVAIPTKPALPWYVPVAIVAVGGVLLYKYGAKALKV